MDILALKTCGSCAVTLPLSDFNKRAGASDGLQSRCRPCQSAAKRVWRTENAEHVQAEHVKWLAANPGYLGKRWRERKYGLSDADYQNMVDAHGSKCGICASVSTQLVVDHDHSTGAVRGLLCHGCNVGLGFMRDNPTILANAILYLR